MSKIVSPYPPYKGEVNPAPNAQWWRLRLTMNENKMYTVTTANPEQGWLSLEFFDGCDTVIDTGFDKPTLARMDEDRCGAMCWPYLDVLFVGPPTPSPRWEPLTQSGEHSHPDDEERGD